VRRAQLAALASLAGLGGCGGGPDVVQRDPRLVTVPDVVSLAQAATYCRLEAAGLRWRTGGERIVHSRVVRRRRVDRRGGPPVSGHVAHPCGSGAYSGQAEVHVLDQFPAPGARVPRGTIVQLEDGCTMLRALATACL
jgi:hypothetical protein